MPGCDFKKEYRDYYLPLTAKNSALASREFWTLGSNELTFKGVRWVGLAVLVNVIDILRAADVLGCL